MTALYLVLSGAEVATQRSFIMIAIVLIGVMLDRPALTLRTVTIAALVVLFLAPEAVVHPSFQMSFAATLALIAAYAYAAAADDGRRRQLARRARRAVGRATRSSSLMLASLIAGLATTPYAAYHFHRLAPYGVIANLLAMPIVSAWVMPMGILGVIAIPFGFDAEFWRQMGYGIEWMDTVALWVASLPGAFGRVTSFGTGPLLLATAGLLVIGLLKTPLRWSGAAFVAAGARAGRSHAGPDVLVAADGRTFAVRGASGKLAFHRTGSDTFAIARMARRRRRRPRLSTTKARRGHRLRSARLHRQARRWPRSSSYAFAPDAFEEDCRRAAIIVATRDAPPDCDATVIGRKQWREQGALALYRDRSGSGFTIEPARPLNYDRPWAPRIVRAAANASSQETSGNATAQPPAHSPPPRDATPRSEDLQADD